MIDDAGEHSSSLEVQLADPDGRLALPVKGAILNLSLGSPGKLVSKGAFIIDGFRLEGPPDIVIFNAMAAPFDSAGSLKPFQSRKSRSFSGMTLGEIVSQIAGEVGLTPAVDPAMASISIPHIDQTSESSMNLLTRLARIYGALFKPTHGRLCFVSWGTGINAQGKDVGGLTIDRTACKNYAMKITQRGNFDKVRTRSHDVTTGSTFLSETTKGGTSTTVISPQDDTPSEDESDDATYEHPHDYPDQDTAVAASKSIRNRVVNGSRSISVTILGNAKIVAGGMMNLTGFKKVEMNGQWWISRVEHEFGKEGFVTTISGISPLT